MERELEDNIHLKGIKVLPHKETDDHSEDSAEHGIIPLALDMEFERHDGA